MTGKQHHPGCDDDRKLTVSRSTRRAVHRNARAQRSVERPSPQPQPEPDAAETCNRVARAMRAAAADIGVNDEYGRQWAEWAAQLEAHAFQLRRRRLRQPLPTLRRIK